VRENEALKQKPLASALLGGMQNLEVLTGVTSHWDHACMILGARTMASIDACVGARGSTFITDETKTPNLFPFREECTGSGINHIEI